MTSYQQPLLIEEQPDSQKGPIECLGLIFASHAERRAHFTEILRQKLRDPKFRRIDGFPKGGDEDILAMSDPPYYTACPNPFMEDFIRIYGEPREPNIDNYHREPFAADVSEGKRDPIYNAHSYHTKVPHKAIMRYILHYTEPNDLVLDGFCGTGMTGVAAQLCGDRSVVESLGYRVDENGIVYHLDTGESSERGWFPFSEVGLRRVILNDLSPAATFIAYNYNKPVDALAFEKEAKRILKEVEAECGWMYETKHSDGTSKARINYVVWSDVFICSHCSEEVVFHNVAVSKNGKKVRKKFPCSHCGAILTKRGMERAYETKFDDVIKETVREAKQVPVLINYSVGRKRFDKKPDAADLALIERITQSNIPYWFPTTRLFEGGETRRNDKIGITHIHHFYTKRNLWVLAALRERCRSSSHLMLLFTSQLVNISRLNRYRPGVSFPYNPLSGTLYVGSQVSEANPFIAYRNKIKRFVAAYNQILSRNVVECSSSTCLDLPDASFDYIFTDPPFGGNLAYSELNVIWEEWLGVTTNRKLEAVENRHQGKTLVEYQSVMTDCFNEYYRVLKPGRWITVEFHNSKNSVWNSIQEAMQYAGFVIADVRTLDKQLGTFKQVTSGGAVKQDLIISAYKPNGGIEERFQLSAGTEAGAWDFIRTHLKQLPVFVSKDNRAEVIAERQHYLLYDRMVAFHVQRGVMVPLSAAGFYKGLQERFAERDGMYFLPEQVAEYDKKRLKVEDVEQLQLFVSDEASAIQWLRQQLARKPQSFQHLQVVFMQETKGGWQKYEELLELSELLQDNFLKYEGNGEVPSQIHSYLSSNYKDMRNLAKDDAALQAMAKDRWYVPDPNKASDLEKLRERTLLKEFDSYTDSAVRKLKVLRLEAVRAGFKRAWQDGNYDVIISVAEKIPDKLLREDPKLLMWYDQAVTRTSR